MIDELLMIRLLSDTHPSCLPLDNGEVLMTLFLEVMQIRCYGLVVFNANCIQHGFRLSSSSEDQTDSSTHLLQLPSSLSTDDNTNSCCYSSSSILPGTSSEDVPLWVHRVKKSMELDDSIVLCESGVGGTYFINDDQKNCIAVFKPVDEEPGALLNPKKRLLKPLLPPGGGAIREVAAFLIDHDNAAGVPETLLVHNLQHKGFSHNHKDIIVPKTGSLQKYVENVGNSDTMGSSGFPVNDVHLIGILDIRLLNLDRNGENILVVKDQITGVINLVPIDHSYVLPEELEGQLFYFEWLYWKQAKMPFHKKTLQLIADIDIDKDCYELEKLGIQSKAINLMRFSTILLKKAAAAGLTLYQIACWMTARPRNEVSQFRQLVEKTNELKKIQFSPQDVDKIFEQLVDELISSFQSKVQNN